MSTIRSTTTALLATAMLAACGDDPVQLDPMLTLTVTPATLTIDAGATGESDILVVREDTDETVTLTVTGGGTGVTAAISDVAHDADQTTGTLTVTVAENAVAGPYTFTVKAANGDADDVTKAVAVTVEEVGGGGGALRGN
jgi:hypothetical protein